MAIAQKWYDFEYKFQCYMLGTPDSHLFKQLVEPNGHWFDRCRPICEFALRVSDVQNKFCDRVLALPFPVNQCQWNYHFIDFSMS